MVRGLSWTYCGFPTEVNNTKQKEPSPSLYLLFQSVTPVQRVSPFPSQCSPHALQGCPCRPIHQGFSCPRLDLFPSSWSFSLSFWNTAVSWFTSYFSVLFSPIMSEIFSPPLLNPKGCVLSPSLCFLLPSFVCSFSLRRYVPSLALTSSMSCSLPAWMTALPGGLIGISHAMSTAKLLIVQPVQASLFFSSHK